MPASSLSLNLISKKENERLFKCNYIKDLKINHTMARESCLLTSLRFSDVIQRCIWYHNDGNWMWSCNWLLISYLKEVIDIQISINWFSAKRSLVHSKKQRSFFYLLIIVCSFAPVSQPVVTRNAHFFMNIWNKWGLFADKKM